MFVYILALTCSISMTLLLVMYLLLSFVSLISVLMYFVAHALVDFYFCGKVKRFIKFKMSTKIQKVKPALQTVAT